MNIFEEHIEDTYSWHVHECPNSLYSTFGMIFPDLKKILTQSKDQRVPLSIVVIIQKTENSMDGFSDAVEEERFVKTGKFIEWSKQPYDLLKDHHWCDIVDPSSGLPFYGSRGTTVFIETDDAMLNLGYEILDFGCCKSVCHKTWGTKAFLSCLLIAAPADKVEQVMSKLEHNELK